jgi:hypothetical protein
MTGLVGIVVGIGVRVTMLRLEKGRWAIVLRKLIVLGQVIPSIYDLNIDFMLCFEVTKLRVGRILRVKRLPTPSATPTQNTVQ